MRFGACHDDNASATTNIAEDGLAVELEKRSIAFTTIGDCTAARQAAYAIHDGRKAGLAL